MKFNKIFSAILAAAMCLIFTAVNVSAANADKVVDNADILTDSEEQQLEAKMTGIVDKYGYDIAVVAVAPFAGEAFPVAEKVKVENVDDIPYFTPVVVDRRAGQTDDPVGGRG